MTDVVIADKEIDGSDLWLHDDVLNDDVDVNLMKRKAVYKQESGTVESRLRARRDAFTEMSNTLAESLRGGRITLGMWEEEMRTRMRMYLYGCAALTKGGPQNMTRSDIGKIGAHLKKQYKWLHGFSQDIYDKRDTITAKAIAARSHLYAAAGNVVATEAQAGYFAPNTRRDPPIILPWLPGDGSTRCLNRCGCVWELEVLSENKGTGVKTVQAAWHMRPELEHCDDCVPRDDHVETVEVPIDVDVPWQIGLGGI